MNCGPAGCGRWVSRRAEPRRGGRLTYAIDLHEGLFGMFPSTLRRDIRDSSFEDLEQTLLDPFAGDIARDRWVAIFTRDLVDLVDIDNPSFGLRLIVIGRLIETDQDILNILADITSFRKDGSIGDRERHFEEFSERPGDERLARTGRTKHQDIGLLQINDFGIGNIAGRA